MSDYFPTLYLGSSDDRELIDAQNQYYVCYRNNLDKYQTAENLKKLLEKEDLNLICAEELKKFRGLVHKVGIKETRAIYSLLQDVRDYLR